MIPGKIEKKKFTFEENLKLEEKADFKSEFVDGEIVSMAGDFPRHGQISNNMVTALNNALRKKNSTCIVQGSDLKVYFEKFNRASYPDVMVICGDYEIHKNRKDIITNPILVIEVLSKSTENYDRGKKFQLYRSLPSLKEYVLIDQREPKVEAWYKMEENVWKISNAIKIEDSIPLFSIDCEIALSDIYYLIENFNQ